MLSEWNLTKADHLSHDQYKFEEELDDFCQLFSVLLETGHIYHSSLLDELDDEGCDLFIFGAAVKRPF